ncbi:DNA topoisomerase IB [Cryomorphaceae bacterium 1068]|nr:DNA topoisomerase IB [Cryomorphaceae bacterium 1068]
MANTNVPPGLIYTSDDQPGITRKKHGKGFAYYYPNGEHIKKGKHLKRIQRIVIPPAWKNVWISPLENAHLQATGRDERKRKQYRYHELWIEFSKAQKYHQLIEFARALPDIRKRYSLDLQRSEWDYKKVAALAVAIMDSLHLRIGNSYYSKENHTFGLTTLRRKHLNLKEDSLKLSFTGKTGRERNLKLEDNKLIRLIKECSDLPGYEVFRYKKRGEICHLKSEDFNQYLRKTSNSEGISAKDFRTWGANVLCLEKAEAAKEAAENSRKTLENTLVKMVAKEMGHTISTCKSSYLHPTVLKFAVEATIPHDDISDILSGLDENENMLLSILQSSESLTPQGLG